MSRSLTRITPLSKKPVKAKKKAKAVKTKAIKKAVTAKKSPAKKKAVKKPVAKTAPKMKVAVKKVAKKSPAKKAIKKVTKATVKKAVKKVTKAAAKKAPKKVAKKAATKVAKKAPRKLSTPKAAAIKIPPKPVYHFDGPAAPQVKLILAALDDAKAENTVALNIAGRSFMADAMVVTTGRINRHVSAIADQVIRKLKETGAKGIRVEGQEAGDWCLVDTGDVIIHIFRPEVRSFYNLEKLWSADAPKEQI